MCTGVGTTAESGDNRNRPPELPVPFSRFGHEHLHAPSRPGTNALLQRIVHLFMRQKVCCVWYEPDVVSVQEEGALILAASFAAMPGLVQLPDQDERVVDHGTRVDSSDLVASNRIDLIAMASNLPAMASNLEAMPPP